MDCRSAIFKITTDARSGRYRLPNPFKHSPPRLHPNAEGSSSRASQPPKPNPTATYAAPRRWRRQRRGAPLRRLSTLSRATAQQATATPSAISAPTARARPPSPPLPRPRRLALFANGRGAAASESEAPLSPLQLSLSDSLSLSPKSMRRANGRRRRRSGALCSAGAMFLSR